MNNREKVLQEQMVEVFLKIPKLNAKVSKVEIGHTYCRCFLKVGPTVKEYRIKSYAEYIARELRLESLPIVHTIFSEGAIVIDIPNTERKLVELDPCLKSFEFKETLNKALGLPYIVGVENGGGVLCGDLTKAPHLLIAGQSGSGKSVAIRCVLNSLLSAWAKYPSGCQYVLLDPKGVELIHYRDLEEVLIYSSDPEEIEDILEALVVKMEERYHEFVTLADCTEQEIYDIDAYNRYQRKGMNASADAFPYLVIIIDELADILINNNNCEKYILRLAQKARAAGIHLVMATQRPSSDIISGPIRANIPTKICCKTARPIDARVVFGDGDYGAHRLLGKGDLLYLDERRCEPIRLQGAYTDKEFIQRYLQRNEEKEAVIIPFDRREREKLPTSVVKPFDVHSFTKKKILYG